MKKNILFISLSSVAACAVAVGVFAALNKSGRLLATATDGAQWVHYKRREATPSEMGIREYWVQCGGSYQFDAPLGETPTEGVGYDTSEFDPLDDRYFPYMMDENYCDFTISNYGATQYSVDKADQQNWKATFCEDEIHFVLWSEGTDFWLWRIDLPRIDYTRYPTVSMKVSSSNWYEANNMGPAADNLPYHTQFGGSKEGHINLTLGPTGVYMEFTKMENASTEVAFSNTFTDPDIIHGLKPAYFYTQDKYERPLHLSEIDLSTTTSKTAVMHFGGDTSKLSAVAGTVKLPESADYSIKSNGYATNDTGLCVVGNDPNEGTAVITLPVCNFDSYLATGAVTFQFGVKNNNEPMYFGSGASKINLGRNSSSSQSSNNNGYVNWQMIVMDGVAYVHNVNEDKNYIVELTAGMRNGTENIVISGGNDSIYRIYLVTDFYWELTPDYPLVAPVSPTTLYSYAGDTSKLSAVAGTVKLPESADYSIKSNGYATNDTGLCVVGNDPNEGTAVITLPTINFKPFAAVGKVTFQFGVKNNNEPMYFGSGASKIDLGRNSSSSQSSNNNGYVNWEMVITAEGAYVHNVNTDQNINVTLTAGMRNGTENIVISGGNDSIYRVYLFTDFYWSAL